ncbi:hypothetical protein HMPREF1486_00105 [Streptomyces sp. HPH0547]|nr:hypothetical protein HMPREF1486_00105 [Streptomyces sp. HPH0547]
MRSAPRASAYLRRGSGSLRRPARSGLWPGRNVLPVSRAGPFTGIAGHRGGGQCHGERTVANGPVGLRGDAGGARVP